MKKRFTQKEKDLTKSIILNFGYWSNEYAQHIENYHPYIKEKVHNYALQIFKNN